MALFIIQIAYIVEIWHAGFSSFHNKFWKYWCIENEIWHCNMFISTDPLIITGHCLKEWSVFPKAKSWHSDLAHRTVKTVPNLEMD